MTITLQDMIVQEVARFFHNRGMEPAVDMEKGELEFEKPEHMSEVEFTELMGDMQLHITEVTKKYRTG